MLTSTEAALRFQPSKRSQQKPKPRVLPKSATSAFGASSSDKEAKSTSSPVPPIQKTTLADWAGDNDANDFYSGGQRAARGGRNKKRKKNKEVEVVEQNWDDIYDPTRPTNYATYKDSDERVLEIRDWRDRLYAHRDVKKTDSSMSAGDRSEEPKRTAERKFAPPAAFSFAPPASYDDPARASATRSPSETFADPTGEDAYARRMRLSGLREDQPPAFMQSSPPAQPLSFTPSTRAPAFVQPSTASSQHSPPASFVPSMQAPAFRTSSSPKMDEPSTLARPSDPPAPIHHHPGAVISAAPVRYNLPAPPADLPATEEELEAAMDKEEDETMEDSEEAPRSNRPGQKGFAERLMKKYGWSKGQGLGSAGTGITTALAVKVEKRKKKPDALGGGFVGPSGMGKIVGGKKKKGTEDAGPGMSPVVICRHMVDGMDLDYEMGPEGNLVEEIGKECESLYGNIKRVFIHRGSESDTVPVFLEFTEAISALRAVSALQGRVFAGNTVQADFYDAERFDQGIYE